MAMTPVRQSIGGLGNLMFKQAYLIGKMLDGDIPDVYLQSSVYWEKHKDQVRGYFKSGIVPNRIDKVAIHIRRGDYLKAEHYHTNLTQTNYYDLAIKMFPGKEFLVFCKDNQGKDQDLKDREWCESFMDKFDVTYSFPPIDQSETEDLNMMAECTDLIMANSSFSWWGAFLGDHQRVICPREETWFVDKHKRVGLERNWIQI